MNFYYRLVAALLLFCAWSVNADLPAYPRLDESFADGGLLRVSQASDFYGLDKSESILIKANDVLKVFGEDGRLKRTFSPSSQVSFAGGVTYTSQGSDKFLVRWNEMDWSTWINSSVLVRFNLDGSIDESFGDGGALSFRSYAYPPAMIQLMDGGMLLIRCVGQSAGFEIKKYMAGGLLDQSFASAGLIQLPDSSVNTLIELSNGKLLVVGALRNQMPGEFFLARFNQDGSLDAEFGEGGYAYLMTPSKDGSLQQVLEDADGGILLAYADYISQKNFYVSRFDELGNLDLSYAGDGVFSLLDVEPFWQQAFVQQDGKILLVKSDNEYEYSEEARRVYFRRYHPSGMLDDHFGVAGQYLLDKSLFPSGHLQVFQKKSGKIVISPMTSGTRDFMQWEVDPDSDQDGVHDNNDGDDDNDGLLDRADNCPQDANVDQIDEDGDGVGSVCDDFPQDVSQWHDIDGDGTGDLADNCRYDINVDQLDTDSDGKGNVCDADMDNDGYENANDLFPLDAREWVDSDGDATGDAADPDDDNDAIPDYCDTLPFTANPYQLDSLFGTSGKMVARFGEYGSVPMAVLQQADGKLVTAGYRYGEDYHRYIELLRFNPDGSADHGFGVAGRVLPQKIGKQRDMATSIVQQPDGKLVVAGLAMGRYYMSSVLIRYNEDGSLDTTFGRKGTVVDRIGRVSAATSLVLLPDGRLAVAGSSAGRRHARMYVALYLPDGRRDKSFGKNGVATATIGDSDAFGYSLVRQSDGKFVVAGSAYATTYRSPYNYSLETSAIVRFNADGSLDAGFGNGGSVITQLNKTAGGYFDSNFNSVIQQQDGKLVAVGIANPNSQSDAAVVRYLTDGSLDAGFASGGIQITDFAGNQDNLAAVLQLPDGRLAVAGSSSDDINWSTSEMTLMIYNPDGSFDTTLNGTGKWWIKDLAGGKETITNAMIRQMDGKLLFAGTAENTACYGCKDTLLVRVRIRQ